jgi:hypothetical protein
LNDFHNLKKGPSSDIEKDEEAELEKKYYNDLMIA